MSDFGLNIPCQVASWYDTKAEDATGNIKTPVSKQTEPKNKPTEIDIKDKGAVNKATEGKANKNLNFVGEGKTRTTAKNDKDGKKAAAVAGQVTGLGPTVAAVGILGLLLAPAETSKAILEQKEKEAKKEKK